MISTSTQTFAIIKLNWCRLNKGKAKWGLLFFLLLTLLPYIIIKSVVRPKSFDSGTFNYPLYTGATQVYLDSADLPAGTLRTINATLVRRGFKVLQSTKTNFIENVNRSSSIFASFQTVNTVSNQFSYTLSSQDKRAIYNLRELWFCATEARCGFSPVDMSLVALLQFLIDSSLTNSTKTLEINKALKMPSSIKFPIDTFSDLFFLPLGLMLTSLLIEEKTKGLKFALFMTGVRRNAYYIGTLAIPFAIAIFYAVLDTFIQQDLWASSSAIPPLLILTLSSCLGYVAAFWVISQLISDYRSAVLLVTLYVIFGYLTGAAITAKQVVIYIPSWAIVLLTLMIPKMGLNVYTLLSFSTTQNGFSSANIPSIAPSGKSLF